MLYAMSSINTSPLWLGEKAEVKSKYEKCQDITTEIYKRINITFAIKNLEAKETVSDATSELIDSNELSNGTDLFAYEKTDSLSSSVTLDECFKSPRKVINLNNNEETLKKPRQRLRRAKKRFRKRVKKKLVRPTSDTDCSSDEEPLSRIVVDCKKRIEAKRLFDKRVKPAGAKVGEAFDDPSEREESPGGGAESAKTNPVEEALSEQMAKEYEFFSKVMEEVGEGSDLDTVLMPALYPEVDLYERKLGLPRHDVTYYTFADLVNAGPSTSQPKLAEPEFTKVQDEVPSTSEQRSPSADTNTERPEENLVTKSPKNAENTEKTKTCEGMATPDPSVISVCVKSDANLNLESSQVLNVELAIDKKANAEFSKEDSEPMNLSVKKEEHKKAETRNGVDKRPKKALERKQCDLCKLTFCGNKGLKRHMKTRCKAKLQCTQPQETMEPSPERGCGSGNEIAPRRHVGGTPTAERDICAETSERCPATPVGFPTFTGAAKIMPAGQRRHACATCGRRYARRSALREHAREHRAERAHACAVCHKSFARYDTWRRHQRVHNKMAAAPETR